MAGQSKGASRSSPAVVLAALMVSAALLFAASPYGLRGTRTTTITSTTTSVVTIFDASNTTQMNSNGLEFMMSLNTSSLDQQGSLTVSLSLINTLDANNTVDGYPTTTNWHLTNQSENGPINCAQNDPFRTEVLQGYYDLNNYTKGTPIVFTVWRPPFDASPNGCLSFITGLNGSASSPPLFILDSESQYTFSPMSNRAQWVATGLQGANQSVTMGEKVLIEPSLFTRSTGVFTVLSSDEWGDIQVLHFSINRP